MTHYWTKMKKVDNGAGYWNYLDVTVMKTEDDAETEVGNYTRNYSHFYDTFLPFTQKGRDYALIARSYMLTAVMDLQSGEIIAEEEMQRTEKGYGIGFCPVEFWHPNSDTPGDCWDLDDYDGEWALVAGCVWGDDSSWKVQYLDLSKITEGVEGIVRREDRFGYVELGAKMAKNVDWWPDGDLILPVRARAKVDGGRPRVYSEVDVL